MPRFCQRGLPAARTICVGCVGRIFALTSEKVGAVSLMQNTLFLHMFFAPESDIPKYNNDLTRTERFSLKLKTTAKRIE